MNFSTVNRKSSMQRVHIIEILVMNIPQMQEVIFCLQTLSKTNLLLAFHQTKMWKMFNLPIRK